MGIAKRRMEEDEDLRNIAMGVCIDAGALAECEHHPGSYYDGGEEVEGAYRLANARISSGQIVLPNRIDRRAFTDFVKDVYEDNRGLDGCASCDKLMRE